MTAERPLEFLEEEGRDRDTQEDPPPVFPEEQKK
jgi:hypothetical protein